MREAIEAIFGSLSRWPLLLGAAVCYGFAAWDASHPDADTYLDVAGIVVGSVLLGARPRGRGTVRVPAQTGPHLNRE
jgi:hypothetical protein